MPTRRAAPSASPWLCRFAVCVAACLALLARRVEPAAAQLLSPGPLAASHAKWEGDSKCDTCHSAGAGVPNAKCNACHEPIAKAEASGTGLHGRKFNGRPCVQCHSDHRGRGFALVRFAPSSFNHEDAGWPLRGAHATTKCGNCHKTKSYLGLSQACSSCHKDPHENRFGGACLNCHNEASWSALRLEKFDHATTRYPLTGAHTSVKCQDCHKGNPPKYRGLEFSACTSCHQDPHRGKLGGVCQGCHSVEDWHKLAMTGNAHPWLSLANGHARTGCTKCHDRGNLNAPSRGRACVGCHSPVHEANFGKRCEACHASIQWLGLPRKIGLSAHERTPYALAGQHIEVACSGCHKPTLAENQRYRGLAFERCSNCHEDAHSGRFQAHDRGECGGCHSEAGFRPARFGVAEHESMGFPLAGHHAAVACSSCHDRPASAGRRLDWSTSKTRCENCHENPHGSQFAEAMRKNGCASCHTAAGWDIPKIDHSIWPLTGSHASTQCSRCHQVSEAERKAGNGPSYRLAPRDCEGCHDDVHRGQFRLQEPKRACDYCHNTSVFQIAHFDHEGRAGYALSGGHRALACGRCHDTVTTRGGAPSIRYRLGYRRCRDCHADPHAEAAP